MRKTKMRDATDRERAEVQRVVANYVSRLASRRTALIEEIESIDATLEQIRPVALGVFGEMATPAE